MEPTKKNAEKEAAQIKRRTGEVALAEVLSTPAAKQRLAENGKRVRAKQAASASSEPKAEATARPLTPVEIDRAAKAALKSGGPKAAQAVLTNAKQVNARAKENLKAAGGKVIEPKADKTPRTRGEWFCPGEPGKKAQGPFANQEEALATLRKDHPKDAERLVRKKARFVRVGVWVNTVRNAKDGTKTLYYTVTREGNERLLNLPAEK